MEATNPAERAASPESIHTENVAEPTPTSVADGTAPALEDTSDSSTSSDDVGLSKRPLMTLPRDGAKKKKLGMALVLALLAIMGLSIGLGVGLSKNRNASSSTKSSESGVVAEPPLAPVVPADQVPVATIPTQGGDGSTDPCDDRRVLLKTKHTTAVKGEDSSSNEETSLNDKINRRRLIRQLTTHTEEELGPLRRVLKKDKSKTADAKAEKHSSTSGPTGKKSDPVRKRLLALVITSLSLLCTSIICSSKPNLTHYFILYYIIITVFNENEVDNKD